MGLKYEVIESIAFTCDNKTSKCSRPFVNQQLMRLLGRTERAKIVAESNGWVFEDKVTCPECNKSSSLFELLKDAIGNAHTGGHFGSSVQYVDCEFEHLNFTVDDKQVRLTFSPVASEKCDICNGDPFACNCYD